MTRRSSWIVLAAAASILLALTPAAGAKGKSGPLEGIPRYKHVAIVILENEDEATTFGDELAAPASPWISRHRGSGGGASAVLGAPSSAGPMRTLKSCSRTISLRRSVISWNMSKASFLYSVSGSRCP